MSGSPGKRDAEKVFSGTDKAKWNKKSEKEKTR